MANFTDGINYGRNYSLEFNPLIPPLVGAGTVLLPGVTAPTSSVKLAQENKLDFQDYRTGLAIEFTVTKTVPPISLGSTDKAEITIFNLNPETSRSIQRPGQFTFSLGHGGDLAEVFIGKATTTSTGIIGNDTFLTLPMVAGDFMAKGRYFSKTYNIGASTTQISIDLISFIRGSASRGLPATEVVGVNEFDFKDNVVYTEPKTLRGDAVELLSILHAPKYYVFITAMNTVNIIKRNEFIVGPQARLLLAGPSLLWSPKYGQVDYIKFISRPAVEGVDAVYSGIESRGILTPDINVGTIMNVDAGPTNPNTFGPDLSAVPEKFFCRVNSVKHFGNTYTGEFLTKWAGDFLSTDQLPEI